MLFVLTKEESCYGEVSNKGIPFVDSIYISLFMYKKDHLTYIYTFVQLVIDIYLTNIGFITIMKIGYIRVSTVEQNIDRQTVSLAGMDKIFTDYASGKDIDRKQFKELLEYIREGDELYVHSMDRLARNLDDLRNIVTKLTEQGINVNFIKEGLTFNGKDDSAMSKLLLSMMGAFAEFELELRRERQREGIAEAKKRGAYKNVGRKKALAPQQVLKIRYRVALGESKSKLAKEYNVSRQTLYNSGVCR